MENLFDTANYPAREPKTVYAGSMWSWMRGDISTAYPTAEYTLVYRLAQQATPFESITITAAKLSGVHVVQESITGARLPGAYRWQAVVVRDSDSAEVTVATGNIEVLPAAISGVESASWVYQVLSAIQATLKGSASKDQQQVEIAGRSIISRPLGELLQLEKEFSKRWRQEQQALDRKNGRPTARVLVGMSA